MGTIYQRHKGGPYYGYWTDVKGRHHRKSLRTRDATVARARLRQHELVSTDPATHSRHTLTAAIGDLLNVVSQGNSAATWSSYRQKGTALVDVIGDVQLGDLTRDAVLGYVRHRRGVSHVTDSTIHKELVVLRRALEEAKERGLWSGDPKSLVPSIRVRYRPRERWLDAAQAKELLDEIAPKRRLWAALAMWAGLRLSEIEGLTWERVDVKEKRLRAGTKTPNAWRVVPLAPGLLTLLKAAGKGRPATAHVVEKWPNVRRDLAAAIERINVRRAGEATKRHPHQPWPKVTPNDLRRTFASWLKQQGTDSLVVAHMLGHSSTRMVELVYGRLADENYQRAIASLPKLAA